MGSTAMIRIIDTDKSIEERQGDICYLHRNLLYEFEKEISEFLSPHEYNILTPEWHEGDEDIDNHSRDPRELIAIFKKLSNFLQENSGRFPLYHWVNTYKEPLDWWYGTVDVNNPNGGYWSVNGHHGIFEHRNEVRCVLRNDKREVQETQWVPAYPEIIIAGTQIRVYTRTLFELCQPDIEMIIGYCEKAIQRNLRVSWTVG